MEFVRGQGTSDTTGTEDAASTYVLHPHYRDHRDWQGYSKSTAGVGPYLLKVNTNYLEIFVTTAIYMALTPQNLNHKRKTAFNRGKSIEKQVEVQHF